MISRETVGAVRDRADIVAVIGESVPSLKLRGRSYVGLCPFHKEKSPSFHVNRERGFFHCFGCKESGSAIDFLMKMEGLTFPEAVRDLAARFGVTVEESRDAPTRDDGARKLQDEMYSAMSIAANFYEEQLAKHDDNKYALEELEKRGLLPGSDAKVDETLTAFRIGYAPGGWDGLANALRAQGVSPVVAESVGLLVPRSSGTGHYDRFRHRLMFCVMDIQGRVVAFSGRVLRDLPGATPQDKPAKYINTSETPIYTKGKHLFGLYQARHQIRREDMAIVVEGNFDVVSLHARGLDNVVAPLGTAFTKDQANILGRFTRTVTLFFDADAAGRKAVHQSREPLREEGFTVRVATAGEGKDPDELVREKGAEFVTGLVSRAPGLLVYLMEEALDESFHSADLVERARRVDRIAKLMSEEKDPLVRSMAKTYADQIAGRLDLSRSPDAFRELERRVKHALAADMQTRTIEPMQSQRVKAGKPGSRERREIVSALLDFPELVAEREIAEALELLEGPGAKIAMLLRRSHDEGAPPTPDQLAEGASEEMRDFIYRRFSAPLAASVEEARQNLLENANKLRKLVLAEEGMELAKEQIRVAGNWDEEMALARGASARHQARLGLSSKEETPSPEPEDELLGSK